MRWLVRSGLRFGRVIVALAIALPFFAYAGLQHARVDVYPEFAPPTVQIQAEALGLSAAEVEQLITVPLEQDLLNGVPWLDHLHSRSEPGLSAIDLVFDPGTDIYAARQMVQERLTQAYVLPAVGSPPVMIEPLASTGRVAMIGLSSSSVSMIDMSVLARWKIRPKLMGIPGVANVAIFGQRDRQLQVQVDPAELNRRKISLTQVIETAGNALWVSPLTFVEASTPGTGGFVESPNQRLSIQHVLPISSPSELAAVPVQDAPTGTLRLGDVAKVVQDHQPLIGDAAIADTPSVVMVVQKFPGADTLEVSRAVDDAMRDMAPGLGGITVDTSVYRPAGFLNSWLHNTGLAVLIGFVLLIGLVLWAFSSWRAAVVALVTVPASLLAAAYVIHLRGGTITTITLLALGAALALVIDDGVSDVDLIRRRLRERHGAEDGLRARTVVEACLESRGALMFATLAILVATVPLLMLSTLTTTFTRPLVFTYALALVASTLVALLLTPTLALALLSDSPQTRVPPARRVLERAVDWAAPRILHRPGRAWIAAAVLAVAGLAIIPQLGAHPLLPTLKDPNLLLQVQAVSGTSLTEMDRVTAAMTQELRGVSGVRDVGVHVGRAISSDQAVDVDSGEIWIRLADGADYEATRSAVRTVARGYPGLATQLVTYPGAQVAAATTEDRNDLVVRVYGSDFTTLNAKAREVLSAIGGIDGVRGAHVIPFTLRPTVQVQVDLAAAQRYGLRPGDVRRDATTLVSQLIVGSLYEQAKVFDVVVTGTPSTRASLTGVQDLLIDTPSSGKVRLGDVAKVSLTAQPAVITHDQVSRSIDVVASVSGRSASAVSHDVSSAVAAVSMPREYHAQVLGSATVAQAGTRRVLIYAGSGLAVIYLLLQAALGSWRRAAMLLVLLPLSGVGGVLVAPLVGGVRSAGALAALFAVFALTVRGAVALARRVAVLEAEPGGPPGDAVLNATRERVLPVLVAALGTAVMLVPVAVLGGRPGLELLRPFAVTALGGLVTSVLVVTVVLPALLLQVRSTRAARPRTDPAPEPVSI